MGLSNCFGQRRIAAASGTLTQINDEGAQRHTLARMSSFANALRILLAIVGFELLLLSSGAIAQQTATVDGIVVNLGIVPAEVALRAEGHREKHPANPPGGSQHILVTLDDAKTGKRIGDAEVAVTVTDPRGRELTKPLLHTQAGGLPDYSELFVFEWSGRYAIRVAITRQPGAKPIEARFTVTHEI